RALRARGCGARPTSSVRQRGLRRQCRRRQRNRGSRGERRPPEQTTRGCCVRASGWGAGRLRGRTPERLRATGGDAATGGHPAPQHPPLPESPPLPDTGCRWGDNRASHQARGMATPGRAEHPPQEENQPREDPRRPGILPSQNPLPPRDRAEQATRPGHLRLNERGAAPARSPGRSSVGPRASRRPSGGTRRG
ncbi:MAG: hypothetical protein K0S70_2068, partial [Microbacterium sp.]|nr:hypothetical protein [Microbacterium sp.]